MQRIYADNAATTRMSEAALEAMLPYLRDMYGNPSSLHSTGQEAKQALEHARRAMAQVLHCSPAELIFTSGGSESDNQAILTGARLGEKQGKKHIISTAFEHHAVLHTLDRLREHGFDITLLPVGEEGMITPAQLAEAIREDTCLVTVMFANNEIGSIQPIGEIGRICREQGVLFHTDAVQAAGHLPIDVQAMCIDMLSLSSHKFHGPKGAGALYARRGIRLESLIEGGAQERGKRAGTENIPAIAGMAAALQEAAAHLDENAAYVSGLRDRLIRGLEDIPYCILNGSREHRLPGNANFCFEGIEGETLLLLLDAQGVCASSGSACTSGSLDASHVLLAIGRDRELAYGSLRLSLSADTSPEEVEHLIRIVRTVVEQLREKSPLWRDRLKGRRPYILEK